MPGGKYVLIVGVSGTDLDDKLESIAPAKSLNEIFGGKFHNDPDKHKHYNYVHALEEDANTDMPNIFYITGKNLWGSVKGSGLGYVLFLGNHNDPPLQLGTKIFERIDELCDRFNRELELRGLKRKLGDHVVGIHAININDK